MSAWLYPDVCLFGPAGLPRAMALLNCTYNATVDVFRSILRHINIRLINPTSNQVDFCFRNNFVHLMRQAATWVTQL